jgi:hypothetical protein
MSLCAVNVLRLVARRSFSVGACLASTGDAGSGVGHGGGSGGSIRDAGGKFGEIEAAAENVYFRKLVSFFLKLKSFRNFILSILFYLTVFFLGSPAIGSFEKKSR